MPQVKGQALHVRDNWGQFHETFGPLDNTWFTCVRWCTRCKALTMDNIAEGTDSAAVSYYGYGLIPRPSSC